VKIVDKIFRKFGTRTVRVDVAVLRNPRRSPAEIEAFVDGLHADVAARTVSNEEFSQRSRDFYGDQFVFIGYAALNKRTRSLELIDMATGEFRGKLLVGDTVIPAGEFQEMLRQGEIQKIDQPA
jgi:hypothetical protein